MWDWISRMFSNKRRGQAFKSVTTCTHAWERIEGFSLDQKTKEYGVMCRCKVCGCESWFKEREARVFPEAIKE